MQYEFIASQRELTDFCELIAAARVIAFDTEFVSEDSYRPQLCLIQVAADDRLAVIDPLTIEDMKPFWELLAQPQHLTIVHAGREELRFCLHAIGRPPANLLDVQIAAGLIGLEYPAAYSTLVSRLLGKTLPKGETRTDWRKRPLTQRQLEYALHDVFYLERIGEILQKKLASMQREAWLQGEMQCWMKTVDQYENGERWTRTPGIANLKPRALAIVRELWRWREQEAERRDHPARRVLRDDLLVELARCETADIKRIRSIRGLDRGDLQKYLPKMAAKIEEALNLPPAEYPELDRRTSHNQLSLLAQFVNIALGTICRSAEVAPSIVGTAQDVRDLVAYHLNLWDAAEPPPALAQGWRAEVVGQVIVDMLAGKLAVSIRDPLADEPLQFERRNPR